MRETSSTLSESVNLLAERLLSSRKFVDPSFREINIDWLRDGRSANHVVTLNEAKPWVADVVGTDLLNKSHLVLTSRFASDHGPFAPLGVRGLKLGDNLRAYPHVNHEREIYFLMQNVDEGTYVNDNPLQGVDYIAQVLRGRRFQDNEIESALDHGYLPALLEVTAGNSKIKQLVSMAQGVRQGIVVPQNCQLFEENSTIRKFWVRRWKQYLITQRGMKVEEVEFNNISDYFTKWHREGHEVEIIGFE